MGNDYWQRILRIDLTSRTTEVQPIEEHDLRRFIGGAGLGGEILRREVGAKQVPYGPENRLIFATGPFQGLPVPSGAEFSVVGISPVTHTFGDTAVGGSWGPIAIKCSERGVAAVADQLSCRRDKPSGNEDAVVRCRERPQ